MEDEDFQKFIVELEEVTKYSNNFFSISYPSCPLNVSSRAGRLNNYCLGDKTLIDTLATEITAKEEVHRNLESL